MPNFDPTLQAAQARLAQVQPDAYARSRNALSGAVTRLSPYITHGILSLRDVYQAVHARHPLQANHKFVFELGWRAYWRHVWQHRGDVIHRSLHSGLLPDEAYAPTVPDDVLQARTGVPAIDQAVRMLYASGYLHNHARMWLASYLVHLRKVHWHAGAQWMLGHLLDGDVASNHLSWQWVAGTGSSKPYLFNAENVAKYAPPDWHSPGTAIDTSYEALDRLARSPAAVRPASDRGRALAGSPQPVLQAQPTHAAWSPPDGSAVATRRVWLVHPWSLGSVPAAMDEETLVIGVGLQECHAHTPWSPSRWDFVTQGLRQVTPLLWWGSVAQMAEALRNARAVSWVGEPHADAALGTLHALLRKQAVPPHVTVYPQAALFEPVHGLCSSFSKWWHQTRLAV